MPLRDHFRPPLDNRHSWEGFHAFWPALIVQQLRKQLPAGFIAEPRVHLGTQIEIDIGTFDEEQPSLFTAISESNGGVATAVWAPPRPALSVETGLPQDNEYAVRVYDVKRGRRLVAAIEIVSPANADRSESRSVFVAKCVALLQKGVCVSIVDVVTIRQFNLYEELLSYIGFQDATRGEETPYLYAATCRWGPLDKKFVLQTWSHGLHLGESLPTLPLWLSDEHAIPLDLESSYEQACKDLWIV